MAEPPAAIAAPPAEIAASASRPAREEVIFDSHVHITPTRESVARTLEIFRRSRIDRFAVKSAGHVGSPRYQATLQLARMLGPRLAFFVNIDWEGHEQPGFAEREAARLEQAMRDGASGIKLFKALGLGIRDEQGKLWPVNTPKLFPLWQKAGEVGAIVALHVGDPRAFFQAPTPDNERYEELRRAPQWSFSGQDYPSWETLLAQQEDLLRRFPGTVFLGIHFGNAAEDLGYVERLLATYPNFHVDTSARLGEIGRHPAPQVRQLFERFPDRILFGSDLIVGPEGMQLGSVSLDGRPPTVEDAVAFYQAHRRYFETDLRQIDHPTPSQGFWKVDALGLSPELLARLYRDNADRLIFAPRRAWLARQQIAPPQP